MQCEKCTCRIGQCRSCHRHEMSQNTDNQAPAAAKAGQTRRRRRGEGARVSVCGSLDSHSYAVSFAVSMPPVLVCVSEHLLLPASAVASVPAEAAAPDPLAGLSAEEKARAQQFMRTGLNIPDDGQGCHFDGKARTIEEGKRARERAKRVELGVIVCAEYSCGRIRP